MCCRAEEFKFEFEEEKLDEAAMRQLVWNEMTHYHPEMRRASITVRAHAGF